ncbi:hypothetical protein [Algoriphagus yeomjeoni]|uniref:Dolichyl-phosphate-mannose-protein mannosyltransferase n=1 Tax=Algoriphagus yeomjeoni TaxID=291403 RepID=A0A327P3T6_9BACT|nr:hypothetical protein [Algoriphagus yeomjeoni]RAI85552.1 hypothetical protein LV83_03632 [Algoriphagus yeomjeoni]
MEKIKPKSFVLVCSLIAAAAMIVIWFLPWRFQVNDDEIMMWLVSGAYTGTPESYAVFIHPILSWTFSKLYTFFPSVPWYPLTWFLVIYLAYLAFLIQIAQSRSTFWTKLIWTLFLFGLLIHFLFFLQFTIVAAFAITAGLSLRFDAFRASDTKWYKLYFSDIMLLVGILIRVEVPILIFFGIAALNLLVIRERRLYKALFIPFVLLLITYSLNLISSDQQFKTSNELRSSVFDHPVLQLNKEDLKESHSELYHYSNGLIDFHKNPDLEDKLNEWKTFLNSERSRQFSLSAVSTALYTYIEHENYLISIMLLFLAFTFAWKNKAIVLVFVLLSCLMVMLSPFYLLKVQIYSIVFLLFFLIALDQSSTASLPGILVKSGVTLLVLGICYHFYSFTQSSENFPSTENLEAQIDKLKASGIDQVVLVAAGEEYHELVFENPLPFQVLGWPTLLHSMDSVSTRAYLVDSATYANNKSYFKSMIPQPSSCEQILLIP